MDMSNLTAQQEAYRYIRTQILQGHFRGGSQLRPDEIAKVLDISHIPVREAMRQLNSEGLITLRANRVAIVTKLSASEVEELFEMRAAFEALAVRRAMERADEGFFEELEHLCQRMSRACNDAHEWIERHNEFHNFMCRQGGGPLLNAEIQRLRFMVQPYILMYIDVYGNPEMQGKEHATLLKTLRVGDPLLAERAVREHVLSAAKGVTDFIKSQAGGNA